MQTIRQLEHLFSEEKLEKRRLQKDLLPQFSTYRGFLRKLGTDFLVGPNAA